MRRFTAFNSKVCHWMQQCDVSLHSTVRCVTGCSSTLFHCMQRTCHRIQLCDVSLHAEDISLHSAVRWVTECSSAMCHWLTACRGHITAFSSTVYDCMQWTCHCMQQRCLSLLQCRVSLLQCRVTKFEESISLANRYRSRHRLIKH